MISYSVAPLDATVLPNITLLHGLDIDRHLFETHYLQSQYTE
jgi:hypothetical protein